MRPLHLLCQPYPKETLEPLTEQSRRMFLRYEKQHPFVIHYRQTGGFAPLRTSDLMSRRHFERSAIYNEYYRRFDSRFQIEFTLPSALDICLAVVFDHPERDFSERDRALLTLFQPHVAAAYRALEIQARCKTLEACVEAGRGAAWVSARGRPDYPTPAVPVLLAKYFGHTNPNSLPDQINRWLRHREALPIDDAIAQPLAPLLVKRGPDRLEVQAYSNGTGRLLLFREHRARVSPAPLMSLGLTPRQAEVLFWIAQAKSNPEIALILGASEHTVHRHVHAILGKLGVESRAGAMLRALEVLGLSTAFN